MSFGLECCLEIIYSSSYIWYPPRKQSIWIKLKFLLRYIFKNEAFLSLCYSMVVKNCCFPSSWHFPFLQEVCDLAKVILTKPTDILKKTGLQVVLESVAYMSVLCSFLMFVYLNGSIVVGDKTAHEATLHITQVFYFATFTLIFGWPHFLSSVMPFIKFTWRNKLLMSTLTLICFCIVHFNTLVHPYMLADNRHYTFYVWNRFYGRYYLFRYAMVFVYIFALYGILSKISNSNDLSFLTMHVLATILVLAMQKLIEIRYYLLPYILFRVQIKKTTTMVLVLESLSYIVLNSFTLYLFFEKDIIWDTYDYPQRLIWWIFSDAGQISSCFVC